MSLFIRAGTTALLLGLAACASEPLNYYTLLAPAERISDEQPLGFPIDVLPVGVPASLDHVQLVVRHGTNEMSVLDSERWVSPFGEEVRSALSAELVRRLGTADVAGLPQPSIKHLLRVKVQIRRFDAWPGQLVQLDADWSLGFAGDAANNRLFCSGHFEEAVDDGYPGLVSAQQRAIAKLAATIDVNARSWSHSSNSGCASNRG